VINFDSAIIRYQVLLSDDTTKYRTYSSDDDWAHNLLTG